MNQENKKQLDPVAEAKEILKSKASLDSGLQMIASITTMFFNELIKTKYQREEAIEIACAMTRNYFSSLPKSNSGDGK